MIDTHLRGELAPSSDEISFDEYFEKAFSKVHDEITKYTDYAEDIITAALNAEQANEMLDKEIASMKKLVDELRSYEKKLDKLVETFKELEELEWY